MSRTQIFDVTHIRPAELSAAAQAVAAGAVAVVPTDTVYGLAAGAQSEAGIGKIYALKNRPVRQPLQLLAADINKARQIAVFPPAGELLAQAYWPGGLTLILPPTEAGQPLLHGAAGLGIRVPDSVFLRAFLAAAGGVVACTSANLHGEEVLTTEKDLVKLFDGQVDFIFKGGTLRAQASSVVDLTGAPRLLREGVLSKTRLEKTVGTPLL